MIEVVGTDEFQQWFLSLEDRNADAVDRVVELLVIKGVTLGHPYSSSIEGARFALRELRVQSGGEPLRVFYAFDPHRQAVLLIGGNKTGDDRFYETMIPRAERIWKQYLEEQGEKP